MLAFYLSAIALSTILSLVASYFYTRWYLDFLDRDIRNESWYVKRP